MKVNWNTVISAGIGFVLAMVIWSFLTKQKVTESGTVQTKLNFGGDDDDDE